MNTTKVAAERGDWKVPVKLKLSALWAALMSLYIYCDYLSLYRPGAIEEIMAGRMGPFPITQSSLLTASLLMAIPAVMIFLSLALKSGVGRWVNIIVGALYSAVNVWNLVGETWAYYDLFAILELVITLLIVGYAWTWRDPEVRG